MKLKWNAALIFHSTEHAHIHAAGQQHTGNWKITGLHYSNMRNRKHPRKHTLSSSSKGSLQFTLHTHTHTHTHMESKGCVVDWYCKMHPHLEQVTLNSIVSRSQNNLGGVRQAMPWLTYSYNSYSAFERIIFIISKKMKLCQYLLTIMVYRVKREWARLQSGPRNDKNTIKIALNYFPQNTKKHNFNLRKPYISQIFTNY